MKKTAIILGATGLTGSILLQKLIADSSYERIKLFSRSKIASLPEKVSQYIGDLLDLEQFIDDFTADEVYCCIGTTKKKTPNKTLYKQIDYGIPVTAAKMSKENNTPTFLVISAMGANKNSSVFYNKVKGEMEEGILNQNIKNTYVLRPSLISGPRKEKRLLEDIGLVVFKFLQPLFIGKLKKYKITEAENIAQAMLHLANNTNQDEVIITSTKITEIANNN
ncbi:NAD(P)H-binding protein [Oceanihabitans sediminis]|uniref:NAD-dependent epimerase/dehydratase family protein n=1 Tax=Oceanihabitans sediminis TaxID=1812012 RepID=A0A368P6H9_9FLAO|nr:NAD(P)H-binding protein [Oceanihabitans sediminis]MDX1277238.1 NAD(P)H-binding protein [Oceanihabitans sediminis]MDX1773657.1 NAD(P)H-binding protein [Oceanihabitans sediminis]RBP33101.1 putative NAD(P)-binding protein [Oceanihabitans sediminis]RCU57389.1 NAD-dependent epimerase/dehydratase family protein [Oceanihabitans sediminis]